MEKRKGMMRQPLLLLEDVDNLGRSGDLVRVKPGFARNFLIPQCKAVVADRNALAMQTRLQEERAKRAALDREVAEAIASRAQGMTLRIEVKVDPDGHMYGSVTASDVARLFGEQGIEVERKNVALPHPVKSLGSHDLQLKLAEGVTASFRIKVLAEGASEELEVKEEVAESVEEE